MNTTGIRWVASEGSIARFSELSIDEITAATSALRKKAATRCEQRKEEFAALQHDYATHGFELGKEIYKATELIKSKIEQGTITQDVVDQWTIYYSATNPDTVPPDESDLSYEAYSVLEWIQYKLGLERQLDAVNEWLKYYSLGVDRCPKIKKLWEFEGKKADADMDILNKQKEDERKLQRDLARQVRASMSHDAPRRKTPHSGAQAQSTSHAPNVRLTEEETSFLSNFGI